MGLFHYFTKTSAKTSAKTSDAASLGCGSMALASPRDSLIPGGCIGVCIDAQGHTTRVATGARMLLAADERGYWVHPGPYACDILPFAATAEIGLRLQLVLDFADPRVARQRFDLFLSSEGAEGEEGEEGAGRALTLARICAMLQSAVQDALARGDLDLPPCATVEEWRGFRAGLNQLIYIRFGLTVEQCLIVDLGESIDYAAIVAARAQAQAQVVEAQAARGHAAAAMPTISPPTPSAAGGSQWRPGRAQGATPPSAPMPTPMPTPTPILADPADMASRDAKVLRRLFLELPRLTGNFRLLPLPPGLPLFQLHKALLQRLDLTALAAGTMPAFAWAAPDQALALDQQARRWHAMLRVEQGLEEAWALLARLTLCDAGQIAAQFEDAERIVTNLETHLAQRRAPYWSDSPSATGSDPL